MCIYICLDRKLKSSYSFGGPKLRREESHVTLTENFSFSFKFTNTLYCYMHAYSTHACMFNILNKKKFGPHLLLHVHAMHLFCIYLCNMCILFEIHIMFITLSCVCFMLICVNVSICNTMLRT